jgi:hypothetical protein
MLAGLIAVIQSNTSRKTGWRVFGLTFTLFACCALCSAAIVTSNSPLGSLREGPILSIYAILAIASIHKNSEIAAQSATNHPGGTRYLLCGSFFLLSLVLLVVIPSMGTQSNLPYYGQPFEPYSLTPIFQFSSKSFLAVEALVCCVGWLLVTMVRAKQKTVVIGFALALFAITVAPAFARNIGSLAAAVNFTANKRTLPADQTFDFGALKGLQIKEYGGEPVLPTYYVGKVKDGIELLQKEGQSKNVVAVLDFSNPFDVIREAKPPKGTPTCWQLNFVFSETSAPPADQLFNGVQAILIPKQFGDGNQQNLQTLFHHYSGYLETNFVLTTQSQQWLLAKRKGS